MESVRIVLLGTGGAILYGIAHDQVTARISVEYFTLGHPRVFDTESTTLLALGWGFLATWWVGLSMGIFLAIAARAGSRPKISAHQLVIPLLGLLLFTAIASTASGLAGYCFAAWGIIPAATPDASRLPPEKHIRYLVDAWAHTGAYVCGFVGGLHLAVGTWRRRGKLADAESAGSA